MSHAARLRVMAGGIIAALLVCAPAAGAVQGPHITLAPYARFGGDANGDGRLDGRLQPEGMPKGIDVAVVRATVDPAHCDGDAMPVWTVDDAPVTARPPRGRRCEILLPATPGKVLSVGVAVGTGAATARITVKPLLVVALGDSVASGEGNPDATGWLEPRCHRSSAAGFEQAARLVAHAGAGRALTFVSLACSGATVDAGVSGPYEGIEKAQPPLIDQVKRLAAIQRIRHVDAVLVSVGANDVHFGAVVRHCFLRPACPSAPFDVGGDQGAAAPDADAVEERALGALAGRYDRLAQDLERTGIPRGHVLISEYFDPTAGSDGQVCDAIFPGGRITRDELTWAHDRVLTPLNAAVAAAAGRHRWTLVDGIAAAFALHGYCAGAQRWVVRLQDSLTGEGAPLSHRADGTLHPNAAGHLAIARAVAPKLAVALGLAPPAEGPSAQGRTWLARHWQTLALVVIVLALLVALIGPLRRWARRTVALLGSGHQPDPVVAPPAEPAAAVPAVAALVGPDAAAPALAGVLRLGLSLAGFVLAALLALGLSFVVGAVIVWVRFWAARFPADQATQAVGRNEVAAIGAQALVVFVVLGAAAAVGLWILDREGTARRPTRRGIAILVTLEVLVAILLGGFGTREAMWLVAGLVAAAVLLHFLLDRALATAKEIEATQSLWQTLGAGWKAWRAAVFRRWEGSKWTLTLGRRLWQFAPLALLAYAVIHAWREDFASDRLVYVLLPLLAAAALFTAPAGVGWRPTDPHLPELRVPRVTLAAVAVVCLAAFVIHDEAWLVAATALAVLLGGICLAVAHATGRRFAPFGAAVLLAVVVYGAALACLRVVDSPQAQPVAALAADGSAVCGLYVGEHDGRVWLAHLQLSERGTYRRPAPRLSRLASVPRAAQVDVALGPLQPVGRAQEQARVLRDQLLREHGRTVDPAADAPCEPVVAEPRPVSSAERRVARHVQPELVVDRQDGFWPVSVRTVFGMEDRRARVCRRVASGMCLRLTSAADLPFAGGDGEWLDYPSDGLHAGDEHDVMIDALGSADPARTATQYFLVSRGRTPDAPWTAQFWFFYTFNYQPVTLRATSSLIPAFLRRKLVAQPEFARGGYHEGDFESVSLLLSARTHRPVYVWMARHKDEGRAYVWGEPGLQNSGRHLTVFAAKGSHADYATCVSQPRPVAPYGVIDDQPQCKPDEQLRLRPEATSLVDLSRVSWGCWRGYFGQLPQQAREKVPYQSDNGPRSPLWQQRFGGVTSEPCRGLSRTVARDQQREEVLDAGAAARLRARAGRLDPVVDECGDWEHPPARGILLVACDPRALAAFRASGYEDPGPATLHVDVADPARLETGPITVPALRRDATRTRLDAWRLTTAKTTTTDVYAACGLGRRNWAVQARFSGVRVVRGHPLRVVDGPGAWRLVADDGTTVQAQPRRVPPPGVDDDPGLGTRCAATG